MATATKTSKAVTSHTDNAGNLIVSANTTINGDVEASFKDTFAAATTNTLVAFIVTKARVQKLVFTSDQAVTLKTNNATTPQETITLTATTGAPGIYEWDTSIGTANPLVGDISAIYVSNAGTATATVTLYTLSNLTP